MISGEVHEVVLWPGGAPGAIGQEAADTPLLKVYPANNANGAAVVVCPGGGYGGLADDHEGVQIARWLNSIGVTALQLRYRHAPRYGHPAPLADAQRALRWTRANAAELGIDAQRIGIWGFSAGGHLASSAGTRFDAGDAKASDPIERANCRPDFLILSYPVITFHEPHAHLGSRYNLIGKDAVPETVAEFSNESQVTASTPPTFLFHTDADAAVPPENSVLFYMALRRAGVPAELHIYERGSHGVGLALADPVLSTWTQRLRDWMEQRGFLGSAA